MSIIADEPLRASTLFSTIAEKKTKFVRYKIRSVHYIADHRFILAVPLCSAHRFLSG